MNCFWRQELDERCPRHELQERQDRPEPQRGGGHTEVLQLRVGQVRRRFLTSTKNSVLLFVSLNSIFSKSWCGSGAHLYSVDPASGAVALGGGAGDRSPGGGGGGLLAHLRGAGGRHKRAARGKKSRSNSSSAQLLSLAHATQQQQAQQQHLQLQVIYIYSFTKITVQSSVFCSFLQALASATSLPPTQQLPPRNNSYAGTSHFETM